MPENPLVFPSGNFSLFGIIHEPDGKRLDQGFVFCHPFAEEKLWAHRVYVNFARILAAKGYTVLRFDYMGHGDSTGAFSQSDLGTRLRDIESAVGCLQARHPHLEHITLLGLRFGATLAALSGERLANIGRLILWEPILVGAKYMKEMMRINITTQSAVYKEIRYNTEALVEQMKSGELISIDGYQMGYPLFNQFSQIDLTNQDLNFKNPVLVLQINRKEGQGTNRYQAFAECTLAPVVETQFWREIREYYATAGNLFSNTLQWIEHHA